MPSSRTTNLLPRSRHNDTGERRSIKHAGTSKESDYTNVAEGWRDWSNLQHSYGLKRGLCHHLQTSDGSPSLCLSGNEEQSREGRAILDECRVVDREQAEQREAEAEDTSSDEEDFWKERGTYSRLGRSHFSSDRDTDEEDDYHPRVSASDTPSEETSEQIDRTSTTSPSSELRGKGNMKVNHESGLDSRQAGSSNGDDDSDCSDDSYYSDGSSEAESDVDDYDPGDFDETEWLDDSDDDF
ncbi:hypothetical protein LTS18_014096 [Coniosporium uncinatum]|uniref:Uncharacterized protein n=1 Tax=Coniosporium uncinatum TaxID=93489 RepID=A0ACC3CVI9_9PEZI|nr:hypothetical protein LTS18_014096 [Coniosporium uncinatum]